MTTSITSDAFSQHTWATERLLEACVALTPDQLAASSPGTYGPILATLRHVVQADSFYLWLLTDLAFPLIPAQNDLDIDALRAANARHVKGYEEYLNGASDPDAVVIERTDDGWEKHTTVGTILVQALHHGIEHRSQVCTVLTTLGVKAPDIDVWAYSESLGRTWEVAAPAG